MFLDDIGRTFPFTPSTYANLYLHLTYRDIKVAPYGHRHVRGSNVEPRLGTSSQFVKISHIHDDLNCFLFDADVG